MDTNTRQKTLFIYGNSGAGKSLLYALEVSGVIRDWAKVVFINDFEHSGPVMGLDVIPFEESLAYDDNQHEYIISIGEPALRELLLQKLENNRVALASIYLAPYKLSASSTIEKGTIVQLESIISAEAHIGGNCLINYGVSVGHNVEIGDHTVISPNTVIGGFTKIGNCTYIGNGAAIRDRIKIGNNCIIGMGSVVTKDIPDHEVWVGNPAKFVRYNESKRVFK